MPKYIGIDTGGTLTKMAYLSADNELQLLAFPSNDLASVKEWIIQNTQIDAIGATGGRTEQLRSVLEDVRSMHYIVEFEATLKGVRYLLQQEKKEVPHAIITNVGTGTSIHYMSDEKHERVGGTGVGGGTLIGLAALTTGITDYEEINTLANSGTRHEIDLLVKDIYQGMDTPISGDLTASNFGKVGIVERINFPKADVLATVQGLVGEVISTLSIQYAQQNETPNVVYIGSTLSDNEHLKYVMAHYTELKQHRAIFLEDHGYAGAVGALLNIMEEHEEATANVSL